MRPDEGGRGTPRWLLYAGALLLVAFVLYRPILAYLSPPPAGQVVRLWHSQRGAERDVLEMLLRDFNRRNEGKLRIEPLGVPESALKDKLLRNVPRGSGPDLFITSHNEIGQLVRGGVVADVWNDDELPFSRETYLPGLLEGVSLDGKLRALPLTYKGLVQFYNQDLGGPITDTRQLEAARSALPEGSFPIAWDANSFFFHSPLFLGGGGRVLDDAGEPGLFDAKGRASFALPGQYKKAGILPPEPTYNEAVRLFEEGKLRSLINGPWYTPGGAIGKSGRWAVGPLPAVEGRAGGSFVTVDAIFVAASSRAPEVAMEAARFLADVRAQGERSTWLSQPPARIDISDGLADEARLDLDAKHTRRIQIVMAQRDALRGGLVTPNVPRMSTLWSPALDVLSASIAGRDVEEAIRAAQWDLDRTKPSTAPPADSRPFGIALAVLLLSGTLVMVARIRRGLGEPAMVRAALIGRGGRRALPFLLPGMLAVVSLVVLPMLVGAGISLYSYEGDTFTFVGLQNFASILLPPLERAFEARSFYYALGVTVLWTVLNVALHVAIGVALALLLRPAWNRLRTVYRVILVLPWAIPNYITALLWKGMFNAQVGAINALLAPFGFEGFSWFDRFSTAFTANLVTNVWLGFPFMMITTLGALSQVPSELEEAATLDGAGRWLRFRFVVWPHVAPALLPAVVLGSVWTFNMFNVVYLVSGGEPGSQTDILISEAYRWAFERGQRYGHAAAYSVLIFFFLLLFSRLGERAAPKGAAS